MVGGRPGTRGAPGSEALWPRGGFGSLTADPSPPPGDGGRPAPATRMFTQRSRAWRCAVSRGERHRPGVTRMGSGGRGGRQEVVLARDRR